MRNSLLSVGEPAPWFRARTSSNPEFQFDSVAGRYVVLCFFGSGGDVISRQVLNGIAQHRDRFDDVQSCFFGVSTDPADPQRIHDLIPGMRYFWDFDRAVSAAFGVFQPGDAQGMPSSAQRVTYILDCRLRTLAVLPWGNDPQEHVAQILQLMSQLPPLAAASPAAVQAPILVVPRVFELDLCQKLIALYEQHGGEDSGFMRDVDGKTVGIVDHSYKRRRDYTIADEEVRRACMIRIHDRLAPEIYKAFQFRATRMERYIVACYEGELGGGFRAHRDNTTKGTAHRRFAVTLNLNTGDFEGGYLRFPEFGSHLYLAPRGGAVVFSCSLLHEATPVTKGRRYVFLPFLYDEEAARIRQENLKFLADQGAAQETVKGSQ